MEIFLGNLPSSLNNNQLKKSLRPYLSDISLKVFDCYKPVGRPWGKLTIGNQRKAEEFLRRHGTQNGRRPLKPIYINNFPINVSISKNVPDPHVIQSLKEEEHKEIVQQVKSQHEPKKVCRPKRFEITSLACGTLESTKDDSNPYFRVYFKLSRRGTIIFGKSALKVSLVSAGLSSAWDVVMEYSQMANLCTGSGQEPYVMVILFLAPKIYEIPSTRSLFAALDQPGPTRFRVSSIGDDHAGPASTCFVYRLRLRDPSDIRHIQGLKDELYIPEPFTWTLPVVNCINTYPAELSAFREALCSSKYKFPWSIRFQIEKLVLDGTLIPARASKLLGTIHALLQTYKPVTVVAAGLQKFGLKIPHITPGMEAHIRSSQGLAELLVQIVSTDNGAGGLYSKRREEEDYVLVHRVIVTPAGLYLDGPTFEPRNRVIRLYPKNTESFIRVSFTEEDGDRIQYHKNTGFDAIFNGTFKSTMQKGITIGGRNHEFLGFSHSSLRSHTCWFMARFKPADTEYEINRDIVISRLGDFRDMPSAAKCAARIGQAFSETTAAIPVDESFVFEIPDITYGNWVFSDGVGTISQDLLETIWATEKRVRQKKPTAYQIRFAGAKGMISLDSRLSGKVLNLRKSMIKFRGTRASDIEICNAASTPLDAYLNRQLIKILEDLQVPASSFLNLQALELERLKQISKSVALSAGFLERFSIGTTFRLPYLLRALEKLNLRFSMDPFLYQVLELSILTRVREMKYKGRIPVKNAVTLYGIMDETNYLKKGQIYCPFAGSNKKPYIITGKVAVTRSPALHPGDVQVVEAVDVPLDSPLNDIVNCVVFSQQGERDVPSMLSGGDLDGDLYVVIFEPSLFPSTVSTPADYSRPVEVKLERPVRTNDIIDFFLNFMQNDQLGRIATLHLALADQFDNGTFDSKCLDLAQMHSTAVDYSKTGIPVDMKKLPRHNNIRPDFMAPSPRVEVAPSMTSVIDEEKYLIADDDDEDAEDLRPPRFRFYMSQKVLGQLFREIDERGFLSEMKSGASMATSTTPQKNIISELWKQIVKQVGPSEWAEYVDWAYDLKELYEDNLNYIMREYSPTPWFDIITEVEVVVGTIVGKDRTFTRRQREYAIGMRQEYSEIVKYIVDRITNEEDEDQHVLGRAVACFYAGITRREGPTTKKTKRLTSWVWIAAPIVLWELEKLKNDNVIDPEPLSWWTMAGPQVKSRYR